MKRDELLLGASVYALIIVAGFFRLTLEKLGNKAWGKPFDSLAKNYSQPGVPLATRQEQKKLLASNVEQILSADRAVSFSAVTQDSIRRNLEEKWKKMASHPAGLEQETESSGNVPPLLGIKTGSATKSVTSEKKISGVEEPMKG